MDDIIRKYIPCGKHHHQEIKTYRDFSKLKCWDKLKKETKETACRSLGTLGGGNHFIEAYADGYVAVHSGSRNIGWKVAKYYQLQAEKQVSERMTALKMEALKSVPEKERQIWLAENKSKVSIDNNLAYLVGDLMQNYLHDMKIMQEFAVANRNAILNEIVSKTGGKILKNITSTHNYIDMSGDVIILRKGAISARKGEELCNSFKYEGRFACLRRKWK